VGRKIITKVNVVGSKNNTRQTKMLLITGWLVLACIVFIICNPTPLYFLNDDFIYISKSPELNYLYRTAFRPVSDVSLLIDYTVYGNQGWGYHVSNLVLHCISTVMVGMVAKRLQSFAPHALQSDWVPHIAAAIFFCYPFHSESIFWIIGRGGSIVTILFLTSFWLCLFKSASVKSWTLAWAFFVAGLLVYESSWLMPFAILLAVLLRWVHGHKITKIDYYGLALVWLTLVISFFVRYHYIHDFIGSPYLNTSNFDFGAVQLLYNYSTGLFRSFLPPVASSTLFVAMAAVLVIICTSIIYSLFKRKKVNAVQLVLVLIFFTTLTPIAILGVNTHNSESERFLYLPSAFLCILLVFTLPTILSKKILRTTYSILIISSCIFLYQSAVAYRIASSWTSISMQAISTYPGKYKIIHLYQLPTQYKGGFVFRLGFEDAMRWICPQVQFDSIQIHSSQEILKPVQLSIASTKQQMQHSTSEISAMDLNIYWSADSISIRKMTPEN